MKLAPSLWFALAMSCIGLLGATLIPLVFMRWVSNDGNPAVSLTVLTLGGVLALIAMLALVAATFSALDLTDRYQALGLPEGTIRAVIALSLIVVFVISSLFLFGKLAGPEAAIMRGVSKEQLAAIPTGDIVSQEAELDEKKAPIGTFVVKRRLPVNKAGEDFARQILTTVGTLVVSIASFYFGAKSVETAISAMKSPPTAADETDGGAPVIGQVAPKVIALPSAQTDQKITATGKYLAAISVAKLVGPDNAGKNDVKELTASSVEPAAETVSGVFTIPPNLAPGDWTLVLETKQGAAVKKPKALAVQVPA